jgi:transposase
VAGFDGFSERELRGICYAQAELLARQAGQLAEQAEQLAQLAQLRDEVVGLRAEVDRLRRRLSRHSGNSSMPPSTDGVLPGAPQPEPRPKPAAGRRRGRQPGTPGSALSWATPDRVIDHRPQGGCPGCGRDLAAAVDVGVGRACQVTDVPLLTVRVTEHRRHAVRCGCGRRTLAPAPPEAAGDAACVYGPNLRALAVYLLVTHAVPVHRVCQLIADLTGARPSPGFVHGMLARTAAVLGEADQAIHTAISRSPVVHLDETSLRVGPAGQRPWVWVAATDRYTLFHLGGRSLATFLAWGIGAHLGSVVVHDNYAVYDSPAALPDQATHQLCVAHLLRHLTDAEEQHPHATWPAAITAALHDLIHAHHDAREAGLPAIPDAVAAPLRQAYTQAVHTGLTDLPRRPHGRQPPARTLLELLDDGVEDILRFTTDTRIPPTNNQAEKDLRPHKTQQKISGRLTSDTTTRHRLRIHGYLSTAAKHGRNAITTLRNIHLGQPWIPPLPAGP